ncbi:MAG: tetratricopeptide repeat protein [Candidatus Hodarchaeota archaeon]
MTDNADELYDAAKIKYIHDASKRKECIELLKKAIKLDPKNLKYWLRIGYFFRYEKDFKNAENAFTKCIEINPNDPWTHYYRGIAKFAQKNYESAINDFTIAENLELEGEEFYGAGSLEDLFLWRADAHEALGNYNSAISDFEQFGFYSGKSYVTKREVKRIREKMEKEGKT